MIRHHRLLSSIVVIQLLLILKCYHAAFVIRRGRHRGGGGSSSSLLPSNRSIRQDTSYGQRHQGRSRLNLVPLINFQNEITFFSESKQKERLCIDSRGKFITTTSRRKTKDGIDDKNNNDNDKKNEESEDEYILALIEEDELPDLCRFIISAFGADAIRLSQDMNSFEKLLLTPATGLINSYSTIVAFAEVFSGTQTRLGTRFDKMDISCPSFVSRDGSRITTRKEMIAVAEKDSLVLALARKKNKTKANNKNELDVIASIELRLQVRVFGKIWRGKN